MKFFYISIESNPNGIYEIHDRNCLSLPPVEKREYIGHYQHAKEALKKAIHFNPNASLCPQCCQRGSKSVFQATDQSLEK
ncbi:hypothetical protein [Cecembia calidifontis]|jgi:hypothetical protein|uniref:Uncharacterized protein n=1 Tax=Cecembia calidifontis TaxID=1187080 RepID=A0A4Q7PD70_9BACT|nr:hypothetical protein [Cecembia calidifontis]RZS98185.1 hypothetical protein BC751_3825 [Cecembia calidifontis]